MVKRLVMTFNEMVRCHFIQRSGSVDTDSEAATSSVPSLKCPEALTYFAPDIDTKGIIAAVGKARNADVDSKEGAGATRLESATDAKVFWRLNSDRFVREFRDATIVQAVTKRIDSSAGKEEHSPLFYIYLSMIFICVEFILRPINRK